MSGPDQPTPNQIAAMREAGLQNAADAARLDMENELLRKQLAGAVDMMRESRIARARGLAQAIAECRDDARLDGIREGAAEIVQLLRER